MDDATNAYLQFLNRAAELRQQFGLPALDPVDERLLALLAAHWEQGEPTTVMEIVASVSELAPSTINRRLAAMREHGWIRYQVDANDARIRHPLPTAQASHYLHSLGQLLLQTSAQVPALATAAAPPTESADRPYSWSEMLHMCAGRG